MTRHLRWENQQRATGRTGATHRLASGRLAALAAAAFVACAAPRSPKIAVLPAASKARLYAPPPRLTGAARERLGSALERSLLAAFRSAGYEVQTESEAGAAGSAVVTARLDAVSEDAVRATCALDARVGGETVAHVEYRSHSDADAAWEASDTFPDRAAASLINGLTRSEQFWRRLGGGAAKAGLQQGAGEPSGDGAIAAARGRHERARRHFDLGDFDKAEKEWQAAYDLDPRPEFLRNIGTCHQQRGEINRDATQLRLAIHFFQRYKAAGGKPDPQEEIEHLQSEIEKLDHGKK